MRSRSPKWSAPMSRRGAANRLSPPSSRPGRTRRASGPTTSGRPGPPSCPARSRPTPTSLVSLKAASISSRATPSGARSSCLELCSSFLNWRVALWVGVGLVTALAGTILIMEVSGVTLNLLTMFGLIVVLGILVDDAIVVAENIQHRHDQGEPRCRPRLSAAGRCSGLSW